MQTSLRYFSKQIKWCYRSLEARSASEVQVDWLSLKLVQAWVGLRAVQSPGTLKQWQSIMDRVRHMQAVQRLLVLGEEKD